MAPHEELLQKIGIVRSRWKAFIWVRGLAWVLGVTVVSLLIGSRAREFELRFRLDGPRPAVRAAGGNRRHGDQGA